jgi:TonB-linked SusC/RagA family outer membrane protein
MNSKNGKYVLTAGLIGFLLGGIPLQSMALGVPSSIVQQARKVTGTVSDAQGPIIGATVKLKGGATLAVTDLDGKFTATANPGQVLQISYVGYVTREIKVGSATNYDITLQEDNNNLNEVVVVGYGTMKKSDVSGASVSMSEKDLKGSIITSLDQSLQGRAAGVTAVSTSGAPGTASSIRVRGTATINANAEPLYVVDGVIMQPSSNSGSSLGLGDALGNGSNSTVSPLSTIDPADIVSMEILKDASATAIYGAQAANGVVLITTKHGKAGEAKFTYNGMAAWNRQSKRLDMMNLREYANFYNGYVNEGEISKTGATSEFSDPSILGKGTNWQDAVFQTAFQQSHQVSAQGGSDKVQYYASGSYMDQEGTIIGSKFNRLNFRVNIDAQLKKWLKMGINTNYADTKDNLKLADSDEGLISYSLTTIPSIPIYNIDGSYSSITQEGYSNPNPIAMALMNVITLKRQKLFGNIYFEVTPIKHLVWHTELGYDMEWSKAETYEPMVHLGFWVKSSNESRKQNNTSKYWQIKNYLTYSRYFDKHSVTAMIGQEAWKSKYDFMSIYNTGLPSDEVHNPMLGSGTPKITNGWGTTTMASYFTRWTYSYDSRYNMTYTYRRDGSSNFGPNKRWAGFHSVAGSWRFSEEEFIRKIAGSWLSNGKLRIGWGQTGNSNIGAYLWGSAITKMSTGLGNSYRPSQIANKDIKWETQEQWNVGLDLGVFRDRVNLTVDWYRKESKDMLMQLQLPSYMGTSGNVSSALQAPFGNYGDIRNTGWEISLNTHPLIGKFQWDSDFQISFNKNKLISLSDGSTTASLVGYGQWNDVVTRTEVGKSLFHFYGYVTDGLYTSLEDIQTSAKPEKYPADNHFSRTNSVWIGDVKYKDLNGDGVINEKDQTDLGSPFPKFTFGWNNTFHWKNFDLNIFVNGSYGNKVFNYMKMKLTNMKSTWTNQLTEVQNCARLEPIDANKDYTGGIITPYSGGERVSNWYDDITNVRISNANASQPRATLSDPNDNDRISDRYVEDGSYLRLKNISLGYTFPKSMIKNWGIESLRLYVNIQNLFTITGYDGYDPEIGVSTASSNVVGLDNGRYPSPTTYSFGVNLTF